MKPILCNYYITYRCNARCQFCTIWHDPEYQHRPDSKIEDVEENLSALKKIGVKFIDFTGGEPLLHPELPMYLALAKEKGFITSVTTNCLRYPDIARKLQGKVDLLHFSLDSTDARQHDALRGKAVHHRVLESIFLALQLGERPDLLYTVTRSNYRALEELAAFAAKYRLMLIVNPVFVYSNQLGLSESILDEVERFRNKPYVYMNLAMHKLIREKGNRRKQPICRAVTSTVVISPENELLLPCFHHAQTRIPIQSHLIEMMNSTPCREMKKKEGRFPFCEHCSINCYFDPSFLYGMNTYLILSLLSKAKYGFDKYVRSKQVDRS